MTEFTTPQPPPFGGSGWGNGSAARVDPITQTVPNVAGAGTSTLHDVLRSSTVNPLTAFGAAAGLRHVAGRDPVNQALNRWAGKTPEAGAEAAKTGGQGLSDAERLKNLGLASPNEKASAAKAAASAPASAAESKAAGQQAVTEAKKSLIKKFTEDSSRVAVKEASLLAARNGAKFGASMALRLVALGTPGLGTALTLALWMFDTDGRRAFNNLLSSMLGVGAAPDLNAPPQPPRTKFLPITNDGNRDDTIEKMDRGMVATNQRAFGFAPDDVWPTTDPNIPTTSDYSGFRAQLNQLGAQLKSALEAPASVYQSYRDEPYVAKMWSKTKPGVDAMADVHSKVLPQMGTQFLSAATATNNAYQAFRQVNLNNRAEINNSTSGLWPGRANHVNAGKMSDSTDEIKQSVADIDRIAQELAAVADPINVVANRVSGTDSSPRTGGPTQSEPQQPVAPVAPVAPAAPRQEAKPDLAKDLASQLLGRGMPGFGNPMSGMGAPQVPQVPQGLGQALGGAKPLQPLKDDKDKDKELRDKIAEKLKPKEDGKDPMKPEGPPQAGPAGTGAGAGKPVKAPLGKPGDPKASNTVTVDGKPWKFDNPKLAQFVNNLANPEGGAHKSVRQSAIDAGYHLPPLDKDIGKPVSESEMKPGAVIMGPDNRNAVFLGETAGQAMVRTEAGETTTLDKVLGTGAHVGIFELLDDGAAAATPGDQGQVQQAGAHSPAGPPAGTPAGSPSTADTDPGVVSGQQRGATGLNPGTATTGS